jgi:hypothetical protein
MRIKLLKFGFFAASTVVTFTAGAGAGALIVAWSFAKMHDYDKARLDKAMDSLSESFNPTKDSDAMFHDSSEKSGSVKD